MSDLNALRTLYQHTAPFYEPDVVPAFGPLAADLARWIARCVAAYRSFTLHDPFDLEGSVETSSSADFALPLTVLDIGTGTGALARALLQVPGLRLRQTIGLDVSPAMLAVARRMLPASSVLVSADLHHLPLRRGTVQLAVSSFGLNASTPRKAFRALTRVLRPGEGLLAFQDWGAEDECSKTVDDVLARYASPDETLPEALQRFYDGPRPWYDQLQYPEDFYEMLKASGCDLVWVREAAFVTVRLPSVESFLASKLAWPYRQYALQTLDLTARERFTADVLGELSRFANADGSLDWSPALFRVLATI